MDVNFIHSFVEGLLIVFILVIMNNVTINSHRSLYVCMFLFLLYKYLGVQILDHKVSVCSTF